MVRTARKLLIATLLSSSTVMLTGCDPGLIMQIIGGVAAGLSNAVQDPVLSSVLRSVAIGSLNTGGAPDQFLRQAAGAFVVDQVQGGMMPPGGMPPGGQPFPNQGPFPPGAGPMPPGVIGAGQNANLGNFQLTQQQYRDATELAFLTEQFLPTVAGNLDEAMRRATMEFARRNGRQPEPIVLQQVRNSFLSRQQQAGGPPWANPNQGPPPVFGGPQPPQGPWAGPPQPMPQPFPPVGNENWGWGPQQNPNQGPIFGGQPPIFGGTPPIFGGQQPPIFGPQPPMAWPPPQPPPQGRPPGGIDVFVGGDIPIGNRGGGINLGVGGTIPIGNRGGGINFGVGGTIPLGGRGGG